MGILSASVTRIGDNIRESILVAGDTDRTSDGITLKLSEAAAFDGSKDTAIFAFGTVFNEFDDAVNSLEDQVEITIVAQVLITDVISAGQVLNVRTFY